MADGQQQLELAERARRGRWEDAQGPAESGGGRWKVHGGGPCWGVLGRDVELVARCEAK